MYQNKDVSPENFQISNILNNKQKQEITKVNFRLGYNSPEYKTNMQKDFQIVENYSPSASPSNYPSLQGNNINNNSIDTCEKIRRSLRRHNYVLGDFTNDYFSDYKLRFVNPNAKKIEK
jgi:hypothetical protein